MILRSEFKNIAEHYKELIKISSNDCFLGIANEKIVDNYYLLIELKNAVNTFSLEIFNRKYVNTKNKLYQFLLWFLETNNYKVDQELLINSLCDFQRENNYNLSYKEIRLLKDIIYIIIIRKISSICSEEKSKVENLEHVKDIIGKLKDDFTNFSHSSLTRYLDITKNDNMYFVAYFNEHIKDLGKNSRKIFKQFNDLLVENDMSLREIINNVHLANSTTNLTVDNAFKSLINIKGMSTDMLYLGLNAAEKILNESKYFSKMTIETKNLYRDQLLKVAKKNRMNPLEFASTYLKDNDNIEAALFKAKKSNSKTIIYILLLLSLTIITSYFMSLLLSPYKVLSFFCLLIPVSEIINNFIKIIILKFYKSKPIPKMDFSDSIPDKFKTMIVVPTIIKDVNKLKRVFENLESFYITNRKDNLYYTLISDCAESGSETCDNDNNIINESFKIVNQLNEKYGRNVFFFVYRKRQYNQCEESWLGYERKRGALLNFNDLILGNLSSEEENRYFCAHNFQDFKEKIKYVITLDVDTKLTLDSAFKLIGAMAHPLNTPVLNENNYVTSGYAIMQPKVSVDITSTNKSLFSQIFAGIGGFDSYNYIFTDFYQDVFGEGTFVGKGIYDLEVFQHVLKGRFPRNQILSHDLLEGSYLRCADVLDVALIDDFPTKFLVDASRRSRWARGDIQIIGWLKRKVRNETNDVIKNPISLISRFKIFDNIRRSLIDLFLVIVILIAFLSSSSNGLLFFLFAILVIISPVVSYFLHKLSIKNFKITKFKYHNILLYGNRSIIIRMISLFSFMPYNAYLYISSFIKSTYRMLISKKKLLNWITSEDAEKFTDSSFGNIIKQFWPNYIVSLIILVLSYINNHITGYVIAFIFLVGPIIAYLISKDISPKKKSLNSEDKQYLEELAHKTWQFFADNMIPENNYLVPDNYQLNKDYKGDYKTSSTNIGLSLLAIVSACELSFINREEAINRLTNSINTIMKLSKWNGHLYNWYNIRTLQVLKPSFVSSVDSGNFVASLIVVKEFLKKQEEFSLSQTISDMIDNTNFQFLCNSADYLSTGYNDDEGRLRVEKYDMLMSECRIASYVAIAKGDISNRNWFILDKTLTKSTGYKGIISYTGTAFEYFMPLIFMKNYENTLLDETYHFAYYNQRKYISELNPNLPWGVSECAYDELDDAQYYKYRAYGVPNLSIRPDLESKIVIAPYASILAITEFPEEIVKNIRKFENINMRGIYGLYESYDVDNAMPVYSFYAHHQGMILSSLTNALKDGVIQNYFSSDLCNKVFTILTKEKVQFDPVINFKVSKYKRYKYKKEHFENDVRIFYKLSTLPELSILSNSEYSLVINDRGNGYSKYNNIQLNRYRKITEQDYGMFLYIKDVDNNNVWTNTYSPLNIMPKKYEVVFALDRIKFVREDDNIVTTTEIMVTRLHHAEIRRITFKNKGNDDKLLELTTYTEPIIADNMADISHRVYNSLFLESQYDIEHNALIFMRKDHNSDTSYYMASRLLVENPVGEYEYETNRLDFIGRGRNIDNPIALERKLNNNPLISIDPIISLRNKIRVAPNSEVTVYLINAFGKSCEQIMTILNTYSSPCVIEDKGFEISTIINNATTKLVEMTASDMRLYNEMLNYLLQSSHIGITKEREESLKHNILDQSDLWQFGISGDNPIILVEVKDLDDLSLLKEVLRAYEYYKSRAIPVDLVIINSDNQEFAGVISKEIETEKYHMYALNNFYRIPGNIYVLEPKNISNDIRSLLNTVARLKIDSSKYNSLQYYIRALEKQNTINIKSNIKNVPSLPIPYNAKSIKFFNEFGGFMNNGKEYLIVNNDTPHVWSNIIANGHFGTLTTNNSGGFTYLNNSREYKLTSWTNDVLLNDLSEGIRINDQNLSFNMTKFGFGYSQFYGRVKNLDIELTEFIALKEPLKFYKVKIKNSSSRKQRVVLKYWINPSLGVTEEKTSRYLLCDYNKEDNYVSMRNVYNKLFNNLYTFITSNNRIDEVNIDEFLFKEISTSLYVEPKSEKEIDFILGCSFKEEMTSLIGKYNNSDIINSELNNVQSYWHNKLETIQVKTPDESFDYMLNGWLLYQTISSRINARAGFYQVSGAFGFRDQLQDTMNICLVSPDLAKKQILFNAKHQFKEGDVMHWWHEETGVGMRSLYKDDYLWLIYAVSEYINITSDSEILKEKIPFVIGPTLENNEKDRCFPYTFSEDTVSLYEHCKLAIEKSMHEIGSNGLPLMGGGDWNDGMNRVGINGQGTSVWLGFFLYQMINKFVSLTKIHLPEEDTEKYTEFNEKLKKSILEVAWDGKQYLRAFFDNGNKLGSLSNEECSIDLLSQSFAILTDIATPEQRKLIINSVEDKLVDKELRIIKLLTPAFENSKDNPGYIMNYPKGIRENGGQYTHSVAWYIMALIKEGFADKAFKYYQMINPINRTLTKEDVIKYKVEPYVMAADIYSNDNYPGQGGWTWYTGSSGWFYHVGLVSILGFQKLGNKLYIKPNVPSNWQEYDIAYRYEDTVYDIHIELRAKENSIKMDGKILGDEYINLVNDTKKHSVIVRIGE